MRGMIKPSWARDAKARSAASCSSIDVACCLIAATASADPSAAVKVSRFASGSTV